MSDYEFALLLIRQWVEAKKGTEEQAQAWKELKDFLRERLD